MASHDGSRKKGNESRSPVPGVADPVRCRAVPPTRETLEHVAQVADERSGPRYDVDPALGRLDLKPTRIVLGEDREQSVVGVLADAPLFGLLGYHRRVPEDTEENEWVAREVLLEPRGRESECEGDAAQDGLTRVASSLPCTRAPPPAGRPGRRGTGWTRAWGSWRGQRG